MSYANAGNSWSRSELRSHLATLKRPAWVKGITFHHTAVPSLAHKAWANGWNAQLIANMRDGYKEKGWSSGPHFYPDDHEIWGLTPPTEKGTHAKSFNATHLGIEVLGDYDTQDHLSGRGAQCWQHAFECAAELLLWLGLEASAATLNFHRDDPKTSKSCPGTRISKQWVIAGVAVAMNSTPPAPAPHPANEGQRVVISEWLAANGRTAKITRDGPHILVGGSWIESAVYDPQRECTTALEAELVADVPI
jgi:hypothetical protein